MELPASATKQGEFTPRTGTTNKEKDKKVTVSEWQQSSPNIYMIEFSKVIYI